MALYNSLIKHQLKSYLPFLLPLLLLGLLSQTVQANDARAALHSLDYIAVDYPATVANGIVINQDEYNEQLDFSEHLLMAIPALPAKPGRDDILEQVQLLFQQIKDKRDGKLVAATARNAGRGLAHLYQIRQTPRAVPDLNLGAELFHSKCVKCHGVQGYGDGPKASQIDPPPINFHDFERAKERSVYGLYNAISLGVDGTMMVEFDEFSDGERWALAFYVSNFVFSSEQRIAGKQSWRLGKVDPLSDIVGLTQLTPADVKERAGEKGLMQLAYLRSNPQAVMAHIHPLDTAVEKLGSSISSYRNGNVKRAYYEAIAAYLDGLELAEPYLVAANRELQRDLEQQMISYRNLIKNQAPLVQVESHYHALIEVLDQIREDEDQSQLSSEAGAISAGVILLREGLEAMLLLAAIIGVLIKTGNRDALPYVHLGWITALIAGVITWVISTYLFSIGGANREVSEGITALLASALLVYVGFWLHDKTIAEHWHEFVKFQIKTALRGRTLWALSFVSFLAVYREVFETVLFYQALWLQTVPEQHIYLWFGVIAAAALLLVFGWGIFRFSMRLPLRLLFTINAAVLFVLAVIFSGHGVAALQEAGILSADPLPLPRVEILGLYPTVETVLAQLFIGALIVTILMRERYIHRSSKHTIA